MNIQLRDLCDTLCVTLYDVTHEENGGLRIPFYKWEKDIFLEYHDRKNGRAYLPTGEWTMATAINDCIERKDAVTLEKTIKDWLTTLPSMSWNEQELFIRAWTEVLPRLKGYGRS